MAYVLGIFERFKFIYLEVRLKQVGDNNQKI